MTSEQRTYWEQGAHSVLNDLWNAMSELESTRGNTSYGRGQLYILRELAAKMDLIEPTKPNRAEKEG